MREGGCSSPLQRNKWKSIHKPFPQNFWNLLYSAIFECLLRVPRLNNPTAWFGSTQPYAEFRVKSGNTKYPNCLFVSWLAGRLSSSFAAARDCTVSTCRELRFKAAKALPASDAQLFLRQRFLRGFWEVKDHVQCGTCRSTERQPPLCGSMQKRCHVSRAGRPQQSLGVTLWVRVLKSLALDNPAVG